MRRLTLHWSKNRARLVRYNIWRGDSQRVDGTNYVTEQISATLSKRYRTMRGCKREDSIRNVSSLIAWVLMLGPDYELG